MTSSSGAPRAGGSNKTGPGAGVAGTADNADARAGGAHPSASTTAAGARRDRDQDQDQDQVQDQDQDQDSEAQVDAGGEGRGLPDKAAAGEQRARRSRSKAAVQAAQERARVLSESVKRGVCMPPKRNRPFEMTHPAKLGMVRLGPFWYSPDPKSPFYLSFEAYGVLARILPFYEDPKNLLKFHKARSVANLRFFLNFHILHCKTAQVLACDQHDTFMVDFSNEYRAMQRRYTRDWFDEFNRGPSVLLFDAPPEILQQCGLPANPPPTPAPGLGLGDLDLGLGLGGGDPGLGLGDGGAMRHMLCVAPRQLNYFHWIFVTGKYDVMCAREPKLHPTLNEFVKGHRERKSRMQLRTRQKLCGDPRGPVVVDRPAQFTMCM